MHAFAALAKNGGLTGLVALTSLKPVQLIQATQIEDSPNGRPTWASRLRACLVRTWAQTPGTDEGMLWE